MAQFLQVPKLFLIILLAISVACAVSRNEKRSIAGALWSRSSMTTGEVTKTGMTSSEDGSSVVSDDSMEQSFLRRLGMETSSPLRRSKRSRATQGAVPGYMTEILRRFQRQTRNNWNLRKQNRDKETIVTGVMPYRVSSLNKNMLKVYFHLSAVLKLESIALAEFVVRQPHSATLNEREGRTSVRSLVICRETEASDSCRILPHKPITRRRHFDIYDVTRSVEELRTEQTSMSSAGGNCSGCYVIMTLVHRGSNELTSGSSDVILVVSNQPIADLGPSENSTGTERQRSGRSDRSEAKATADDPKMAMEQQRRGTTTTKDSRRQRREVACSLNSWYLDFAKLGWTSWIRFPLGYYANYCSGSCVIPSQTSPGGNMTNHAFVKGLYRTALQNDDPVPQASIDALPATCCVPVRLSPMNILYRNDDDNWIIRVMSEMVADQCGCL